MPLSIAPVLPSGVLPSQATSASKHVVRKRLVEVRSENASSSFSYDGTSEIIFSISSPSDFWDTSNSYIRFKLTCTGSVDGANDASRYLAEGGAHALIRNMVLETSSGVQIARIDRYNKLAQILIQASTSCDYVDEALCIAGDSCEYKEEFGVGSPVSSVIAEVAYDHAGGAAEQLLTLANAADDAKADIELAVGDILRIETAVLDYTVRVLTIESSNTITVEGLPAADIAAGDILSIVKMVRASGMDPVRKVAANTANYVMCFQPLAPFLNIQHIPLMLIRGGLKIRLQLERPAFVLASDAVVGNGVGYTNFGYTITDPVYMCSMIQPDESLSQEFLDKYNSSGLVYEYAGLKHYLETIPSSTTGTHATNLHVGVRSARTLLTKFQNLRAETVSAATADIGKSTYTCDSIAQGLKMNLSEFHVSSGSERFPQARPVDCTDISNNELYIESQRAMGNVGISVIGKRFGADAYAEVDARKKFGMQVSRTTEGGFVDSNRMFIATELSRDPSHWSGLDLSLQPLLVETSFDSAYTLEDSDGTNGAASQRYLQNWVMYDCAMVLSASEGINILS